MRLVSPELRQAIRDCLLQYRATAHPPGLQKNANFDTLLRQIYDSVRRVEYFYVIQARDISATRSDPRSDDFDPLRAAAAHLQNGNLDEAAWLAFISTHFGSVPKFGWRRVRDVYGCLESGPRWEWSNISQNPKQFRKWLAANHHKLEGKFGNHRKYASMKPNVKPNTADTFESYVGWVQGYSSHAALLAAFTSKTGTSKGALFDTIYREMLRRVAGFSRTGCFDYLCALGKLNIYPIEPAAPYISGATGPRRGAQLLLTGAASNSCRPQLLNQQLKPLGDQLANAGVKFAMQVLEDAICNWQKSPSCFVAFRG